MYILLIAKYSYLKSTLINEGNNQGMFVELLCPPMRQPQAKIPFITQASYTDLQSTVIGRTQCYLSDKP